MRADWHSRKAGAIPEGYRRRYRRSLMPKLFLVLIGVGLFVNMCVGGFWRLSFFRHTHDLLGRNVAHYVQGLVDDFGSPADTAKVRATAERYGLRVAIRGPGSAWETAPGPAFPEGSGHGNPDGTIPGEPGVRTGWGRHRLFVEVARGDSVFTFNTTFGPGDGNGAFLAMLICLVSGALLVAILIVRHLLSPLKGLAAGVERIRRGDLGHQIPVCSRDELGDLARSFNAMSTDLKEMIRSREQLLLDASHELRSPITRIKVALEMTPDGAVKESISDDLHEMETMIAEILETARLDSANGKLNLEDLDLAALVAEAVADADVRAPGARLMGAAPARGPIIRADRARVRKVLANVLDNASKYSRESGSPVEVRIETGPNEAVVKVADKGVGIPAAELPRLFEPFYRVDRSRSRETGGYGLGLSLCKRIMEAHGGGISISSREGEGTEVCLAFPRAHTA